VGVPKTLLCTSQCEAVADRPKVAGACAENISFRHSAQGSGLPSAAAGAGADELGRSAVCEVLDPTGCGSRDGTKCFARVDRLLSSSGRSAVCEVLDPTAAGHGDGTKCFARVDRLLSSRRGSHLWSDQFDRRTGDIFAIQDEIAQSVVSALRVKLSGLEEAGSMCRHTHNTKSRPSGQVLAPSTRSSAPESRGGFRVSPLGEVIPTSEWTRAAARRSRRTSQARTNRRARGYDEELFKEVRP
jgi:hypothetical protein